MEKSSVEVWLWLLIVMQPCNPKTNEILARCGGNATAAARMVRDGVFPFLNDRERKRAAEVRLSVIRSVMRLCAENGVRIVTLDDDDYPNALREIARPPIVLFVAGSLEGLNGYTALAAVGTRNVSEYGLKVAAGVLRPIAKMGITIVSGLAVGADTAAHRAALSVRGCTVGVLGCGILVNYPRENAQLKRDIIAGGGAVISELLPTAKTFPAYFRQRNRIISGLCSGTLVIEAGEKSGSLLTAEHAVEQGREVFCVPPPDIFSSRYFGSALLIRDGAVPVFGYVDIVNRLLSDHTDRERILKPLGETYKPRRKNPGSAQAPENGKTDAKSDDSSEAALEDILAGLPSDEAAVLKVVSECPSGIDELVERCGIDYSVLSEMVTEFELSGYVIRGMDGRYSVSI